MEKAIALLTSTLSPAFAEAPIPPAVISSCELTALKVALKIWVICRYHSWNLNPAGLYVCCARLRLRHRARLLLHHARLLLRHRARLLLPHCTRLLIRHRTSQLIRHRARLLMRIPLRLQLPHRIKLLTDYRINLIIRHHINLFICKKNTLLMHHHARLLLHGNLRYRSYFIPLSLRLTEYLHFCRGSSQEIASSHILGVPR